MSARDCRAQQRHEKHAHILVAQRAHCNVVTRFVEGYHSRQNERELPIPPCASDRHESHERQQRDEQCCLPASTSFLQFFNFRQHRSVGRIRSGHGLHRGYPCSLRGHFLWADFFVKTAPEVEFKCLPFVTVGQGCHRRVIQQPLWLGI